MFPKCFPYWIINGKEIKNKKIKEITYSSKGYLLPCCWCDKSYEEANISQYGLFDDSLKLTNNQNVEEVIYSDIWKSFFNMLEKDGEKPNICKIKCSKLPTWGENEV